ncbi:MAG: histidinol-phosphate transaminase [Bacteroidota bacterium]
MNPSLDRREWLARSGALAAFGFLAACSSQLTRASHSGTAVRLHLNENPYGPSSQALEAMRESLGEGNFYNTRRYVEEMKNLLAAREHVTPDHIVVGCGSGEVPNVAGLVYGMNGGGILAAHPTFEGLQQYAEHAGATVTRVPLTDTLRHDLDAMRQNMTPATRLVYICNPNNPTGTVIPGDELRAFCEEVSKQAMVFVDEAYHEFVQDPAYRSMVELVSGNRNIIVSRTASKIHALAGLRIGFGFGHPDTIERLGSFMTGSLNVVGLRGAIAGIRDAQFQNQTRNLNREGRDRLYSLFKETGHAYIRSQANFVFFRTELPIEDFRRKMEQSGVLVARAFPPYTDWCRVSVGTEEGFQRFREAFLQILPS